MDVSDHAVLRYLERVENLDIEKIRTFLMEKVVEPVSVCGDGRYPIGDGYQAIVKGNIVITVIERGKYTSHIYDEPGRL